MTRPRPRFAEPPRGLTAAETAGYLGLGKQKFYDIRDRLTDAGFPAPDPLTGRYDRCAIDRWLDFRAGLTHDDADDDIAAGIGQWAAGGRS